MGYFNEYQSIETNIQRLRYLSHN